MIRSLFVRLPLLAVLTVFAFGCDEVDDPDPIPEDPCDSVTCDTPPAPGCDGDDIVTFGAPGTCSEGVCDYPEESRSACNVEASTVCEGNQLVTFGQGTCNLGACDYPEISRVACDDPVEPNCDGDQVVAFGNGSCEEGECLYEETGRHDCDQPPPSRCEGDEEVVFVSPGACSAGECSYTETTRTTCESISHVCDQAEGMCVDPCEGVSCPPQDMWCENGVAWMLIGYCDWHTAECVYEETETDLSDCGFAYNFDFEEWAGGEPEAFNHQPATGFRVVEDADIVNTGLRSARLESDITEAGLLRASMPFEYLAVGESYTFHFWYRFQGGASASLRPVMELADENGDVSPEWIISGPPVDASPDQWVEMTLTTPPVTADRYLLRPMLQMRGASGATTIAHVDDWAVTMPHDYYLNSRRDLDSLLFLFNGNFWVASGINDQGMIYPTGRSAEVADDWDQLLFTWVGTPSSTLVPAPWDKAGQVAGPGQEGPLFAVLQNPTGHCEWQRYHPDTGTWSVVSHSATCSNRVGDPAGINYALEGVLDLVAHLDGVDSPSEVPTWFHFAASHWESGAGGALVPVSQAPASLNGNGNIEVNETHRAHRATFLSGTVNYYFP